MATSSSDGDLIDFNLIEGHKENIQALPSGRSAKALAQLYSPTPLGAQPSPGLQSQEQLKARAEFEKELVTIQEADDPLDVYDRYVKWTLETFPSTQATAQSQLQPLLERATKAFQSSSHYKNDPRYLKIWLHYIRLFSDSPRTVFIFLARHRIGESLALFYEDFAAWLEQDGRWRQAEEIYKMGLEKEARPAERLMRKFREFEQRNQARPQEATEPSSPALPIVRPALAAKLDPFSSASPTAAQLQEQGSGSKKPKSKMAIFSDKETPSEPVLGTSTKSWDSIGTLSQRKKENYIEPKPMAGEKLKVGKTNAGVQKMMVFRDQSINQSSMPRHLSQSASSSNHEQQCVLNEKTGRLECVFVNLEAVYPETGNLSVEYSFEELRARHRGLLNKDWREKRARQADNVPNGGFEIHLGKSVSSTDTVEPMVRNAKSKSKGKAFEIFQDGGEAKYQTTLEKQEGLIVETFSKALSLNDKNDENKPPSQEEVAAAKKARREERANRTRKIEVMDVKHIKNETKTIQLNMDSPPKSKIKRKKSIAVAEPTMTINTKEAMEEIYGIFSAPLPSQDEQADDEEADNESESEDDDDYTTGDDSTATGKLSAPASEYGDETRNELLEAQRSAADEDRTDVSGWSDFTMHRSKKSDHEESLEPTHTITEVVDAAVGGSSHMVEDDLMTLVDDDNPRTRYVPVPPEDYEPPAAQFRDMSIIPNHRLPFMTPIVEQTESSLGAATARIEKDYFTAKTPSRKTGTPELLDDDEDEPGSSPFQDVIADLAEDKRRVLQPIRTKSTKGTLALGQGTAKSQTAQEIAGGCDEHEQHGPIVKDVQCNPMDPFVRQSILAQMRPPLSSFEGYHEDLTTNCGRSAEIKKYVRTLSKASRSSVNVDKTGQTLSTPPTVDLQGAQGTYTIKRELGAGTFAPVYLVENSAAAAMAAEDSEENASVAKIGRLAHRCPLEAIKMEEPPSTWEFYILRQSHRRLGVSRAAESIVRAHEMHLYRDECFLVEEFRDQGTLLDLVNIARLESGSASGMDEMLSMWFTVELLRVVEAMHSKQLIHGDLKGDNVLVRFDDPGMETDWSPTYFPSGAHGWSSKGVCLIDFGRGIDMKHFVFNVGFIADWKTSEADCAEMRELRPWTYQVDYHGLAGIVHSLLFGKYMETIGEKGGGIGHGATKIYRIRETFKRYWQTDIWSELFQLLLNPLAQVDIEEGKKMPVVRSMRACRERMEGWLEENCERGVGLKGMISRMEGAIRERRKKNLKSSQSC